MRWVELDMFSIIMGKNPGSNFTWTDIATVTVNLEPTLMKYLLNQISLTQSSVMDTLRARLERSVFIPLLLLGSQQCTTFYIQSVLIYAYGFVNCSVDNWLHLYVKAIPHSVWRVESGPSRQRGLYRWTSYGEAILRNSGGRYERIAGNSSIYILMCNIPKLLNFTHTSFMSEHIAERYSELASRGKYPVSLYIHIVQMFIL